MINIGFDPKHLNFENFNKVDHKKRRHGLYIEAWNYGIIRNIENHMHNQKWIINYEHGIRKGIFAYCIDGKVVNFRHIKNINMNNENIIMFGEQFYYKNI